MSPILKRKIHFLRKHIRQATLQRSAKFRLSFPTMQTLRNCGVMFQPWPEETLQSFAGKLAPVIFEAGEYICHQGDPSMCLYILTSGTVEVIQRDGNRCACSSSLMARASLFSRICWPMGLLASDAMPLLCVHWKVPDNSCWTPD